MADDQSAPQPTKEEIHQQFDDGDRHPVEDADETFTDLNVLNLTHKASDGTVTLTYVLNDVRTYEPDTGKTTTTDADEVAFI